MPFDWLVRVWVCKRVSLCALSLQYLARAERELRGQLRVHSPAPRLPQRTQVRAPWRRKRPLASAVAFDTGTLASPLRAGQLWRSAFPPPRRQTWRSGRRDRGRGGGGDVCSKTDNAGGTSAAHANAGAVSHSLAAPFKATAAKGPSGVLAGCERRLLGTKTNRKNQRVASPWPVSDAARRGKPAFRVGYPEQK